ncbi:SusC/RagA family TonB-linked outer membrane protein [Allomuricauda sp. SCSIO 65647]|uniref:SusC/RagA family TonB-linked outer membrane protein n=1 Tax=Allomuricauda sp. SCSIO 65647 TaxID=2908843 RepID=UPI001F387311|nr:SusC/RagA family TonB-linked outer membrane protein [Muricauda sp. SCSIO 65647]UJH67851.1 SusC/RagA family TonB-linked outer membrane protein [Muricauda sp. SCSIO 65647]
MESYSLKLKCPPFRLFFLALLCFVFSQSGFGQGNTVSGTVTDGQGQPLPGVSIVVKGTATGTQSDFDGNYSVSAPSSATLIFSYIGFTTQEIAVGNQDTIDVVMQEDVAKLDEVVVIGYGTLKQKEVTSAIISVKEESFNRGNINTPEQLLAGKVAGLTVSRPGGSPTQEATIRLRGLTTFGANTEPLIVIDGVIGGSLNNVDPNDIASIDVLKDASAGAIYGTRGSSGVIIITTKSGTTQQKAQLDINAYAVLESIANTPQTASFEEFRAANSVDFGTRTDWFDETTRTGVTNVYNVAFSNNSNGTSYRASMNYRDIEGIIRGQDINVFNTRLNISQNLFDDRLRLTGIMSFTRTNSDLENEGVLRQALLWNPTAPVFENRTEAELGRDPNRFGGYFETEEQNVFNPVAMLDLNTRERMDKRTLTNFKADFEVINNLTLSANYSYQVTSRLEGFYSNSGSITGGDRGLPGGEQAGGRAERFTSDESDQLYEFTASYADSSGDLNYNVLVGYGYQEQFYEEFYATNTDFITDGVLWNDLGLGLGLFNPDGTVAALDSFKSESLLTSYFARANFNYKDTYNLAASFRREASSRFGDNNRWGNFWAVSGSVNLDKLFEFDKVEILKFRAGYGLTGNTPVQRYAFLETLGSDPNNLGFVNSEFIPAVEPTSNPNPDLKWEEKGELNIGLDFSIFSGRVYGSFDYFNRTTSDLLNEIDVPSPPNLFPRTLINLGELETNGFEAQVNFGIFRNDEFTWDFGVIFDTNETKLVRFNNLENSEFLIENLGTPGFNNLLGTRVREGDVIGNIMAPRFVGFNDEGRALVLSADGEEILANDASADDFVVAGNGLPDFSLSFTNTFTYKNFDLNFLWRGVFGHELANLPAAKLGHPVRATQFRYITGGFFNPDSADDSAWHTEYVENASFLRLDNITLGYNMDTKNLGPLTKLRFYASGNNLITITDYSGADPEPRFEGNTGILAPGYDRLGDYFPTRSFNIGINATF